MNNELNLIGKITNTSYLLSSSISGNLICQDSNKSSYDDFDHEFTYVVFSNILNSKDTILFVFKSDNNDSKMIYNEESYKMTPKLVDLYNLLMHNSEDYYDKLKTAFSSIPFSLRTVDRERFNEK